MPSNHRLRRRDGGIVLFMCGIAGFLLSCVNQGSLLREMAQRECQKPTLHPRAKAWGPVTSESSTRPRAWASGSHSFVFYRASLS